MSKVCETLLHAVINVRDISIYVHLLQWASERSERTLSGVNMEIGDIMLVINPSEVYSQGSYNSNY